MGVQTAATPVFDYPGLQKRKKHPSLPRFSSIDAPDLIGWEAAPMGMTFRVSLLQWRCRIPGNQLRPLCRIEAG